MSTKLKTYRLLSASLALSLLFGAAASMAQTTCAMGQKDLREAHECRHENAHSHPPVDAPIPPCPHEEKSTHDGTAPSSSDARSCCAFESASTGTDVAFLSRTPARDAGDFSLAPLPRARYEAPYKAGAPAHISAPPRFTGFPLVDRQALLAAFLI